MGQMRHVFFEPASTHQTPAMRRSVPLAFSPLDLLVTKRASASVCARSLSKNNRLFDDASEVSSSSVAVSPVNLLSPRITIETGASSPRRTTKNVNPRVWYLRSHAASCDECASNVHA
eukprot:Amastigsp_a178100_25.p5 type:complete len:118 gc:universal Amastigsp_a178100_25:887-534(-)